MKLDLELLEVLPDELNHSRKWYCSLKEIDEHNNILRLWNNVRYVKNDDNTNDENVKRELLKEVFESFSESILHLKNRPEQ